MLGASGAGIPVAKGRRDPECDWSPELGIAILQARTPLYVELSEKVGIPGADVYWRSHEAIGAFMGISDARVQQIEYKALRKLRMMFLYRRTQLTDELFEAVLIFLPNIANQILNSSNGNKTLQTH